MLVYTHTLTARCRYICNLILGELLGLEWIFTTDLSYYHSYGKEKLAYTVNQPDGGFFIESTTLLFEEGVHNIEPDVFPFAGTQAFFKTRTGQLSFDLFAAAFYLVSRYEEYLPFQGDQYGRFPATASLAYKQDFLQTPIINCWMQEFRKLLASFYPSLRFRDLSFRAHISFDIDVAYAYKGRPFWWNGAAMLKDFFRARTNCRNRWQVMGGGRDPYDTYGEIEKMLSPYPATVLFFFLLARKRTRFDRNLSSHSTLLRQTIARCGTSGQIGIHPSYYSMEHPFLLLQEKKELETICRQTITKSRQHYLRFHLPDTYAQLAAAGITDDYSMGYAELPGFRAGICTPFYFFNLLTNQATSLKIHPITYMDGTFMEDLQMNPQASMEIIEQLVHAVKKVQGDFLCIWHNHTISESGLYRGWKQVLRETLRILYEA